MTFPDYAAKKGGERRAALAVCVCPTCGSALSKQQRKVLGIQSDLDIIGSQGGSNTFKIRGHKGMSEIGKLGGRGNTKAKRIERREG